MSGISLPKQVTHTRFIDCDFHANVDTVFVNCVFDDCAFFGELVENSIDCEFRFTDPYMWARHFPLKCGIFDEFRFDGAVDCHYSGKINYDRLKHNDQGEYNHKRKVIEARRLATAKV